MKDKNRMPFSIFIVLFFCLITLMSTLFIAYDALRPKRWWDFKIERIDEYVFITIYPDTSKIALQYLFGKMYNEGNEFVGSYNIDDSVVLVFKKK